MDIFVISGQLALLHVKLEPGDGFEVYGGTSEDGLRVERQGDSEWLVTLDEQDVAGRPLVRYNVYARQLASGREWAILGGKIMVNQRTATVPGDKLAPVEYFVTVPVVENAVDLTGTALVTGIVGPRGYSAYEVAVLEGFEGSEAEWLEWIRQQTATKAVEQVAPFAERAERAASDATEHARQAEQNKLAAGNAAASANASAEAAQQAKADAEAAQQEAAADATAAGNAAASANASAEAAQQAKADAGLSKDGAEAAKGDAVLARGEAEAARDGAVLAKDGALVALEGAEAAQVAADDAAGVAAGSAEAAVAAAAEAKAAAAGAAGAADAVRYDFLPISMEWLDSRFAKTLGEGNFTMTLNDDESALTVAVSLDTTSAQIAEVQTLLDRVLPRNLVTEMEWADGLPMSYTRLAHLESTGTQYLRLPELTVTNDDIIKMLWLLVKYRNTSANGVFAVYNYDNGETLRAYTHTSTFGGKRAFAYTWSSQRGALPPISENEIIALEMSNTGTVVNGVLTNYENTVPFSYSDMLLFTQHVQGTFWHSIMRLYSFVVPSKCHLVPALDPTGTPCLFDTVTRKPFRNSGSGQFRAGVETQKQLDAVLSGLPDRTGQGGGELHLRLSDELYEAAVASGIIETTATAKNWQIAYDPTTEIVA